MYRDEILAIGEAVLEARAKGESEALRISNPRINDLENAVRVLYRFVKKLADAEQVRFPDPMPEEPEATHNITACLLQTANERLRLLRNDAAQALLSSRVQYLRPRVPDGEDIPF